MRLQRLLVDHSTWLYSLLASRRVGTTVRWRQRLSPGLECRTWVPCRGLDCNGEALACAEHHVGSCRSSASMSEAGWRTPEGRMALTRTCFYPRRAPFQRHLPLLGEAPAPSFTQVSQRRLPLLRRHPRTSQCPRVPKVTCTAYTTLAPQSCSLGA